MNTHVASRSTFSWHHVLNVNQGNKILPVGIMISQVLSGHLTTHLIQDLDCSIALKKKRFVLALNYEILKCTVSVQNVQFVTPMYLNGIYLSNNGDSLTYKTRMDQK